MTTISQNTVGINTNNFESTQTKKAQTIITALPTIEKKRSRVSLIIYHIIKRICDIIAGIIGVIILIPLTIIVYILKITSNDNEPLFYDQLRVGKNGKVFKIYKFRSMVIGADEKLKKYLEENEEEAEYYKKYKKLKKDPRVTKAGKILRITSLDEWPQFFNILTGQMSLVGPRPYLPREKEDIGEIAYKEIIKVKPGLTGPWQIAGRSNLEFKDRVMLDLEYIPRASLLTDIKITLKTVKKVIKKEGAT